MATPVSKIPTAPKPAPTPRVNRMTLETVVKGRQQKPKRIVIYGDPGAGKTTFGADAPSPIFIATEDGTAQLDVARFPKPENWSDVLDAIRTLETEPHDYRTLVIDTLDWAEPLVWAHICKRDNKANIDAYGYKSGQNVVALDEWRVFIAALERLQVSKGMDVILVAHSRVKTFKDPLQADYDRYEMLLNDKAQGLFKQWSECILFAKFETLTAQDEKKRVRGVSTGARILHTVQGAAYDAKNRYGLPETLPLSWADFIAAVEAQQPASPDALIAEIQRKAEKLPDDLKAKALEYLEKSGADAVKLSKTNTWVNAKLTEKGE